MVGVWGLGMGWRRSNKDKDAQATNTPPPPPKPLDTLGKVEHFFGLVGIGETPRVNVEKMMEDFMSTIPEGVEADALTNHHVRDGVNWALRRAGRAIFLDHNEADALEDACNAFIDTRFGRPDSYWNKDGSLVRLSWGEWEETGFYWSGDAVDEGLTAFADWVRDNSVRVRLINVTTEADNYLAFTCYVPVINEVVDLLADLGINAQVVGVDNPLPPVRDLHAEITGYLEQTYGFTSDGFFGRMGTMFDDQNGATVYLRDLGGKSYLNFTLFTRL